MAEISVFGLGYVGSVLAACLARHGHHVVGVDSNPDKTSLFGEGRSPVVEPGLEPIIRSSVSTGHIRATTDAFRAVGETDVSIVCVGTPTSEEGQVNLNYVVKVCEEIGSAIKGKAGRHIVVVRSTVLPGTTENVVIPVLERASGKLAGIDFGACFNPEFLREGTSIQDFMDPPFTLIGTDEEWVAESVTALYSMLSAPVMVVPFKVAEMVKYVNNAFHALKVCFGNEVGRLCRRLEIDSHQVMDIFCKDTKLNLSEYYLKPGFAFGGSCLPKDLRALLHHSRHLDVSLPVLESVLPSNDRQINVACRMVEGTERKRVGVCGLSFKAGTDDLRESPMVRLIEYLLGKGYPVKVYDENVSIARLNGANRAYIEKTVPHIACLLADSPEDVLEWSDVIVLGNRSRNFEPRIANLRPNQSVIDLVRVPLDRAGLNGNYHGICW